MEKFDWIPCRSEARWDSWAQRLSAGVNDHRARKYTEGAFEECVSECVDFVIEVPNLTCLLDELKCGEDKKLSQREAV